MSAAMTRQQKRALAQLDAAAEQLKADAARAIAKVEVERDAEIASIRATASPCVTKNADGQFFVTMTAEAYVQQGMQAASWQLHETALEIDRAIAITYTWLPSGEQSSWRRGTWA